MTIVETTQNIPQGWYPEPTHGVGQRYWDGSSWTDHVFVSGQQYTSPLETKPKKKIYWGNLLRFRTWWFSLASSFVIVFLANLINLPSSSWTAIFFLSFVGISWYWMHQQMSCNECGTILRVTRISGAQKVCHKCGAHTD